MTSAFPASRPRAGITILEVLIAIGILAIALPSVLSLIPLGRSLLSKAVVTDESGWVLDDARAVVMTTGLANVEALTGTGGGPCPDSPLVIDPLGLAGGAWPAEYGLHPAVLRAGATLSGTSTASAGPRAWPVSALLSRSADDVLMTVPDGGDQPARNRFVNGVRSAAGRTSWFAVLATSTPTAFTAGELATLSIVVCRNRVAGLMPPANGVATPAELVLEPRGPAGNRFYAPPYRIVWPAGATLFSDREDREVVRKGAIVLVRPSAPQSQPYRPPRFRTISAVSFVTPTAGESGALVAFDGDPSLTTEPADATLRIPLAFLPDATAVRDYTVTIEGLNEFTR